MRNIFLFWFVNKKLSSCLRRCLAASVAACSFFLFSLLLAGCVADDQNLKEDRQTSTDSSVPLFQQEHSSQTHENEMDVVSNSNDDYGWQIKVIDSSGEEIISFSENRLSELLSDLSGRFSHAYSTINNWPATRFYAADGFTVSSILQAAGVFDSVQTVTFRAEDGYEISLTETQLFREQYYYPYAGESDVGAQVVHPVIAFRWREGTTDLNELREDKPMLIFGQGNPFEHSNPAFVVGVSEIVIDYAPCSKWDAATTFPLPGLIAEGETVKLQHSHFGIVKLHYTTDGSDPTVMSPMYNPSTYQPELNMPIPITEPTTIKVLAVGYGRYDSDVAEFDFSPIP